MSKIKQQKKVNKKVKFANFESDDEEEIEQGMEEEEAQFDENDDEKFEEIDDEEEDEEEENEVTETASNDGEEDDEEEQEDEEEDDRMEMDVEDEEEETSSDGEGSTRYEEDIEDQKMVEARRKKLPKSGVDDQFFNLAEMEAFLDSQDKAEGEKLQRKRRNLGEYEEAEEMDEIIRSYEEENLKSRGWTLQGEVVADERRKDELLEQKVDVDFRTTAAPTITEEKTANLEAIIKKRIKEKLFDDVVRKFRENEALVPVYRNQTDIEQTVRKSLAEVYEEKFSNQLEGNSQQAAKPELDPKVAAIQKDMDSLFLKLDALSHFQFRPQPIRDEVKIVNNMPSLHIEEVGPTATAEPDANLMAPEELMKRRKRALKAADERTETDRKRERRQKKKKQRILASMGAMKGAKEKDGDEDKEGRKNMKRAKMGGKKLDFAGKMQELTSGRGSSQKQRGVKRKRKTAAI